MRSLLALAIVFTSAHAHCASGPHLTIVPVDPKPKERAPLAEPELARLRDAIRQEPRLRKPRMDLVRALVRAGRLKEAHDEALKWREHDAYNLVAVRQVGDIESSLGDKTNAARTYSAIVELLPKDVEARRAVATLLKQAGELEGARAQLDAALALASTDRRTAFELADVEQRLGRDADATKRFEEIVAADDVPEALRYPARQRLSQVYAAARRRALGKNDQSAARALAQKIDALGIHGGNENDIKVYLSWDTDRTDVDLWVFTPSNEKVFYGHKGGRNGEALYDDVTTGYGPETFSVLQAVPGDYKIVVDYYGSREPDKEARGEVIVVVNEGRADEQRQVFPYRLVEMKDSVMVARVRVGGGK